MIYFFLTISILTNIGLIWYAKIIIHKFVFISDNIDDMFYSLDSYSKHLEALYELETYYGDESLESLIQHSRGVVMEVKNFKDIYSLEEEEQEKQEEDEDGEAEG